MPWDEFSGLTLKSLQCVLVEDDRVRTMLPSRPGLNPWPHISWDHGQLTGCSCDRSTDPTWLRHFTIVESAQCNTHGTSDCLILARGAQSGQRENADKFVSCNEGLSGEDEPVTVCRPCYELSDGLLWRLPCEIRTTGGEADGKIVWNEGRWCKVLNTGYRIPVEDQDLIPL